MATEKIVSLQESRSLKEARILAHDYYAALILDGWGPYRILEEHGFEPHKAKHIIPLNGEISGGYLTEPYVIECVAQYIASGGELVTFSSWASSLPFSYQ